MVERWFRVPSAPLYTHSLWTWHQDVRWQVTVILSDIDGGDVDDHDNGGGDWVDDCDTNANANFEKYVSLGWDGMR